MKIIVSVRNITVNYGEIQDGSIANFTPLNRMSMSRRHTKIEAKIKIAKHKHSTWPGNKHKHMIGSRRRREIVSQSAQF